MNTLKFDNVVNYDMRREQSLFPNWPITDYYQIAQRPSDWLAVFTVALSNEKGEDVPPINSDEVTAFELTSAVALAKLQGYANFLWTGNDGRYRYVEFVVRCTPSKSPITVEIAHPVGAY